MACAPSVRQRHCGMRSAQLWGAGAGWPRRHRSGRVYIPLPIQPPLPIDDPEATDGSRSPRSPPAPLPAVSVRDRLT